MSREHLAMSVLTQRGHPGFSNTRESCYNQVSEEPLMSVNSSPAKIILVHGTWARGFDPEKHAQAKAADKPTDPQWFESGSKFRAELASAFAGVTPAVDISAFLWSGANSIEERGSAAVRLAKTIDESVAGSPETTHVIVAHSHGGNVALEARQALAGNASSVHIVTLATPFLSIQQRKIRIADKFFALIISISIIAFLMYYLRPYIEANDIGGIDAPKTDKPDYFFLLSLFISISSIALGAAMLFSSIYRRFRKQTMSRGIISKIPNSVRRINNQSLLTVGILSCVISIQSPSDFIEVLAVASLMVLPYIIIFFIFAAAIAYSLYNDKFETKAIRQNISDRPASHMTILRSQHDEATLALLFGKITSLIARITASLSIIVSIGALLLILALLGFVIYYAVSDYSSFEKCLELLGGRTNNGQCVIHGEADMILFSGVGELWKQKIIYYFSFGLYVCIGLIFLTALCKSLFGKELLYRSLNTLVGVYDTPEGDNTYKIEWCERPEAGAFGLRHSLYSNPEAVKKIAAYINRVCAPAGNRM